MFSCKILVLLGVLTCAEAHAIAPNSTIETPHPLVQEHVLVSQFVRASFYGKGDGFHGKKMANGKRFNKDAPTVAHKTLPLGTRVKLQYGDRTLEATVTDRGPYVKGRQLDVSYGIAKELGFVGQGTADLAMSVLSMPIRKPTKRQG